MDEKSAPTVEVLWRPGCPFCSSLRRGLRRAGIATVEHDIWADPSAAARVRTATGGDETVPTVVIGSTAMVNPSVRQVRTALRAQSSDDREEPASAELRAGSPSPWPGALWTAAVLIGWLLLVLWRPTTTWHLAPVLSAAAWPWMVGQDMRVGERRGVVRVAAAGLAGFAVTLVVALGLSGADLLRGPTFGGVVGVVAESLLLGGAGALLAVLGGAARSLRRAVVRSAWVGDQQIATSDDVVIVEGNAYFPASSISPDTLTPTATTTVCPWKGSAGYYTVTVAGAELPDAAWTYRRPFPPARRIKGRVAFANAVEIRNG